MALTEIRPPIIIAHRGYSRRYPENTLSAFAAAFEAGAQMIELDAALTKDGHVVVVHDAVLDRTTNGRGPVHDYSLQELRRLDAGSWFHPRFASERIPVLEEVFDRFAGTGLINVEIKSHPKFNRQETELLQRQVVETVLRKGVRDRVLISSFDIDVLERIALRTAPPFTALLTRRHDRSDAVAVCRRLGVLAWHPNHRGLHAAQIRKMHAAGIRVFPYTVNVGREGRRLLRLGVDGIFTDDPPLLKACLAE